MITVFDADGNYCTHALAYCPFITRSEFRLQLPDGACCTAAVGATRGVCRQHVPWALLQLGAKLKKSRVYLRKVRQLKQTKTAQRFNMRRVCVAELALPIDDTGLNAPRPQHCEV